jgi:NTP pyrophosphatase (non-canonical NTP hydrolase)
MIDKLMTYDLQFAAQLREEVARARRKFPDQDGVTLFLALVEEAGEVAQAILQKRPAAAIKGEIIQVAAMAQQLWTECNFNLPDERKSASFQIIDGGAA